MSWNTKVKCIKEFNPGVGATLNNEYEVKKGIITYDNGTKQEHECESINDLNKWNTAKFEELKKRGRPKKI